MVKQRKIKLIVILDKIRSAFNVGSIIRTSDCVGVEKIFFCDYTPTPEGKNLKKISKTSLGAEKEISWEKVDQAWKLIERLRNEKFYIIALENKTFGLKKDNIFNFNLPKNKNKLVLVLGNEVKGLSKKILLRSNLILEIPLFGTKKSLNVSSAFAVVAYFLKFLKLKRN